MTVFKRFAHKAVSEELWQVLDAQWESWWRAVLVFVLLLFGYKSQVLRDTSLCPDTLVHLDSDSALGCCLIHMFEFLIFSDLFRSSASHH